MSEWENLEEYVKKLTKLDETKRTPLSGGTKHEEDVVGNCLLCQCKQTEDKNISILQKDLARLLEGAKLLEKFPLFFSQSKSATVISVPITEDTAAVVDTIIDTIIVDKRLCDLYLSMKDIKSPSGLRRAEKEMVKLEAMSEELFSQTRRVLKRIRSRFSTIQDDITMYNLFDEANDEPKND